MKKSLLLITAGLLSVSAFAQQTETVKQGMESSSIVTDPAVHSTGQKTTRLSDTLYYYNNSSKEIIDTSSISRYDVAFPLDSGYVFGHNYRNDRAFAEQFDFNFKTDTSINLLGVQAIFTGRVNAVPAPIPATTLSIVVWNRGASKNVSTKKFISGFPNTPVFTFARPFTAVGVYTGTVFPSLDSIKTIYFPTQFKGINYPFFVGYQLPAYTYSTLGTNMDTIALRSTRGGRGFRVGTVPGNYTVAGNGDTTQNVRNAIFTSAGTWVDANALGFVRNLSIVPILRFQSSVSVKGYTRDGLTFFGDYPNPATNNTNIKFKVAKATEVNIMLVDMTGRMVKTVSEFVNAGEHVTVLDISNLPAGNYTYTIQTSDGTALASQLTIVR